METEKQIENYLREQVKKMGGKAYKFVSPGNAGVPDRIVVLPGGRVIFVELKSPEGRLTVLQQAALGHLRRMGCDAYAVYSKHEVDLVLKESSHEV